MSHRGRCVLLYSKDYEDQEPKVLRRARDVLRREGFSVIDWREGLQMDENGLVVNGITDSIRDAQRAVTILNKGGDQYSENVLYELGFSHAALTPIRVVSVIDQRIVRSSPFNIQGYQHVLIQSNDLDEFDRNLSRSLRTANSYDVVREWEAETAAMVERAKSRIVKAQRSRRERPHDPSQVLGALKASLPGVCTEAMKAAKRRQAPDAVLDRLTEATRKYLNGCVWIEDFVTPKDGRPGRLDDEARVRYHGQLKEACSEVFADAKEILAEGRGELSIEPVRRVLLRARSVAASRSRPFFSGALFTIGALLAAFLWIAVGVAHEASIALQKGDGYALDLVAWLPKVASFAIVAFTAGVVRTHKLLSLAFPVISIIGLLLSVGIASSKLEFRGPTIPLLSAPEATTPETDTDGAGVSGEADATEKVPGEAPAEPAPEEESILIKTVQSTSDMTRRTLSFVLLFGALAWLVPRRQGRRRRWALAFLFGIVLGLTIAFLGAAGFFAKTGASSFDLGLIPTAAWLKIGVRVFMAISTFLVVWSMFHAPWRVAKLIPVPVPRVGTDAE